MPRVPAGVTGNAAAGRTDSDGTVWDSESMNRLANAQSPYLLQHADNPVDWWPWGEEAMQEARRRNVPVLLSLGYSACHWCQ